MSEIKVNHRTIQGAQANFNVHLSTPFQAAFAGFVQDSSTPYLESASKAIQDSTKGLGETVRNFNDYLNSLSDYLQSKDKNLALQIESVTIKTIPSARQQAAQKKQKAKNSKTYKRLP